MKNIQYSDLENYEINPETFAIIPVNDNGNIYSKILENDYELLVKKRPLEVIKNSCYFFASSFEGRVTGTQKLLNINHKVPIAIDPQNSLYFFPTSSPQRIDCYWIAANQIVNYQSLKVNLTQIIFKNRLSIEIPVSPNIIKNQILRSALLKSKVFQNQEMMFRRSNYMNQHLLVSEKTERFSINKNS